jgi:hypothetical protein
MSNWIRRTPSRGDVEQLPFTRDHDEALVRHDQRCLAELSAELDRLVVGHGIEHRIVQRLIHTGHVG